METFLKYHGPTIIVVAVFLVVLACSVDIVQKISTLYAQ